MTFIPLHLMVKIFLKLLLSRIPFSVNSVVINFDVINFDYLNEYSFYYYINGKNFRFDSNAKSILLPELKSDEYEIGFKIFDKKSSFACFFNPNRAIYYSTSLLKRWWFVSLIVVLF